jgi:tripartite-type tricarboxylate transporter receptor subunit TctC
VPYDVEDFVALGQGARTYWALILPASAPQKDFKEYVTALKRDSSLRSYGVPLTGGAPGVVGNVIGKYSSVEMVQIPFSGSAPVLQNIMAGQVPAGITGMAEAVSAYRSGKAKVLAVTGKDRTPILPEVATFHELGVNGLDFYTFVGFFAPKGLPPEAAREFNAALRKTLADPAVQEKITATGMQPAMTTLEEANREVGTLARFWKETFTKKR